ncbi:hypothetical protein OIU34_24150 [Pararhizobium sp. BT-229]|uniref:hypothetical protein n=1 Tax=Pararhizobium sp. BT-229 TaxID=2986923 RepID=UPI0021F7F229|nr:hypothetical protein [Pararhizobium sp. BT-229]MCV9964992.1 hypothetical protein [Pararhizobium sp. BT-229]
MDDKSLDVLTDVNAGLSSIASRIRTIAKHEGVGKDQALALAEQADELSSAIKRIMHVTGWNGRDFSGNGDRVTASYDVPGLHEVSKRIIEKVSGAPVTDIAHVVPQILEIVFPQLAPRVEKNRRLTSS